MSLLLQTIRRAAALAAFAAFVILPSAQANHFILPCDDDVCADAHWVFTGSLNVPRFQHTATLLQDGRVLVAGGNSGSASGFADLDSAELYDPVTGTWSLTGSMHWPRSNHAATLLSDGRVLVVGGDGGSGTGEIYDPAMGTWSLTSKMIIVRSVDAATRLQDGRVLVAGGFTPAGVVSSDYTDNRQSAELYDPVTDTWAVTDPRVYKRYWYTMTLLQDGRVLAVRGTNNGDLEDSLSSAEIYDPAAGEWSAVEASCCGSVMHTATLLPDGTVLVAGGNTGGIGGDGVLASAEFFDSATQTWSRTGDMATPRYAHTATALVNGDVLVCGGQLQMSAYPTLQYVNLGSTEMFSPSTAAWTTSADLNDARSGHTATLLQDGTVLVAGGVVVTSDYESIPLGTAELFGIATSDAQMGLPTTPSGSTTR